MVLRKHEVINKLAEKTGLYKKDVRAVLTAFHEMVYEEMDADNQILLKNLFKIEPITVKERNRYDLARKCMYLEKEHRNVKITPSINFVNSVRKFILSMKETAERNIILTALMRSCGTH